MLKKCSGDHKTLISISEQRLSVFPYRVESSGQPFIINRAISASPVKNPDASVISSMEQPGISTESYHGCFPVF